jgi:two-component system sensor histidine kinase PrrB
MSLRSRVVLAAVSGVLVTLAIVLAVVLSTFATRERDALDAQLKATLRQAAARPADGGLTSAERASARLVRLADRSGIGVLATSADGRELARAGLAADYPAMHGEPRTSTPHDVLVEGRRLRVATRVGTFATEPARVTVIVPTAVVDDRIAALRTRVLAAGAGGVVLALLLSAGLTRIALRRLDRLRAEADALSTPGHGRLARGGPREIDELTRSLNAMLGRLRAANAARDAALEASRRFAADAGHELRTPLTTMGTDLDTLARTGTLDAMQRELVADLDAEHERLRSLLEALQALARGDAPVTVKRQVVDVGELVDMAADAARTRHPRVDLRCTLDPSSHLDVIAWPEGLRLAFDNLLDNAARHGADRVSITAAPDADGVEVIVDDDGPGIEPSERTRVFERFVRGHSAGGDGSGLGLALVQQQVRLHGGSISITDSPLGGARVHMRIPRDGDPATESLEIPSNPHRNGAL